MITNTPLPSLLPPFCPLSASRRTSSIAAAFAELPDNDEDDDHEEDERDLRESAGDWDDSSGWEHLGARKLEHLNVVWCSQLTGTINTLYLSVY